MSNEIRELADCELDDVSGGVDISKQGHCEFVGQNVGSTSKGYLVVGLIYCSNGAIIPDVTWHPV